MNLRYIAVLKQSYQRLKRSKFWIHMRMIWAKISTHPFFRIPFFFMDFPKRTQLDDSKIRVKIVLIIGKEFSIKKTPKNNRIDPRLKRTIASIINQKSNNWSLLIIDIGSLFNQIIYVLDDIDNNVKVINHTLDYSALYSEIEEDYLVFLSPGDQLGKNYLSNCLEKISKNPETQIIYTDGDWVTESGKYLSSFFKPASWSPEFCLSADYLSVSLIKKELFKQDGKSNCKSIIGKSSIIEMTLMCALCADRISYLPGIYYRQIQNESEFYCKETSTVLESFLSSQGILGANAKLFQDNSWKISWKTEEPLVSIIIPNKNSYSLLKQLIISILELTIYPNYEIIIVDNCSDQKKVIDYYEELALDSRFTVVEFNEAFNYSRANNLGSTFSKGELLLFLNNDMKILHEDWLNELVRWALNPEIGIVGAKLLFPDSTIQHAGIVVGLNGYADHVYMGAPGNYQGLLGSSNWYRNVTAVTGACQMIRKNLFEELHGYDENYEIAFSDVDICVRAIDKGYRNLYTPYANMVHYAGQTRKGKDPVRDIQYGMKLVEKIVVNGDPYFSPFLSYKYIPSYFPRGKSYNRASRWFQTKKKYYSHL